MTYPQFEEFLIRFLQHQFYESLEHYVTNKKLFVRLGGRAITVSATGDKIIHRKSVAPSGGLGGGLDDDDDDRSSTGGSEVQRRGRRGRRGWRGLEGSGGDRG